MLDQLDPATRQAIIALDAYEAEQSLVEFIKQGWHVLEPADPYVHGWHIDAIADHLNAVTNEQLNRLIINVPPGTMKSLAVGVFWPAWEWGPRNLPSTRTIATSYKESLAKRDNIKARRLVQSNWFTERWGHRFEMMPDQNATLKFENDKSGFRSAMSFKSLTGERGHRVIIDDPLSYDMSKSDADRLSAKETFLEAVPNRLSNPQKSAIVLVMQRLHEEDTTGIALARNLGYEHLMLPMEFEPNRRCYTVVMPTWRKVEPKRGRYDANKQVWYLEGDSVPNERLEYVDKAEWKTVYCQDHRKDGELLFPDRFPRSVVEYDKNSMGSHGAAGQLQQRPAPRTGGLFQREWFKIVPAMPHQCAINRARAWDFAATDDTSSDPDWTVGVRGGYDRLGGILCVDHVHRIRATPHHVRNAVKNLASTDGRHTRVGIPQDPGAGGKFQTSVHIKDLAGYRLFIDKISQKKSAYAEPVSNQAEAGNIWLVEGPWNEAFIDELCSFPNGKHDDQLDAFTLLFRTLIGRPQKAGVGHQSHGN